VAQITSIEELRQRMAEPNALTKSKIRDRLDAQARDFIARSPFLLLATQNEDGSLEVSPKGDAPGFVEIESDRSLLVPDRPGNNLAFGVSNVLHNAKVGVIFLAPATGETLRVSGTATLHDDAEVCERLSARGAPAKLFLRVAIQRAYFHCARAVLRAKLWNPEAWPEPMKVSFGRIIAEATAAAPELADRIDGFVAEGYRTGL
jgi:hypothetical protein